MWQFMKTFESIADFVHALKYYGYYFHSQLFMIANV